jgi:hypothetical protein
MPLVEDHSAVEVEVISHAATFAIETATEIGIGTATSGMVHRFAGILTVTGAGEIV